MQQLREDAAQAAQRAASADVKVDVLQKAVQQAEERAAALEMQVSARLLVLRCRDYRGLVLRAGVLHVQPLPNLCPMCAGAVQDRHGRRCPGWCRRRPGDEQRTGGGPQDPDQNAARGAHIRPGGRSSGHGACQAV